VETNNFFSTPKRIYLHYYLKEQQHAHQNALKQPYSLVPKMPLGNAKYAMCV